MGAGCYYTNKYDNNNNKYCKAVWLDIELEDDCYAEDYYEDVVSNLFYDLKAILNVVYTNNEDQEIFTPLYKIHFESTYNGDGIIIKQSSILDDANYLEPTQIKLKNLSNYNFEKNYYFMINKLCKLGYKFRIATSSYTSGEYNDVKK